MPRGVVGEVALAELVGDQPVGGPGIRHPQQRLGQGHQGEALAARERVFLKKPFDGSEAAALAHGPDQVAGEPIDGRGAA